MISDRGRREVYSKFDSQVQHVVRAFEVERGAGKNVQAFQLRMQKTKGMRFSTRLDLRKWRKVSELTQVGTVFPMS